MKRILQRIQFCAVFVLATVPVLADDEEMTFYAFPVTEQVAEALLEVQKEKHLRLDEVLSGRGFDTPKDRLILKQSRSGDWRIETFWGHTNAELFMHWLAATQQDPQRPLRHSTKEEVVKRLILHVQSEEFQHSLRISRAYEKRLKVFNATWLENYEE